MRYRNEFRPQRQPRTITFLSYSQPILEHFGSRRATTYNQKSPSGRKIFRPNIDAVQPAAPFKKKIIWEPRLTNDARCIDDVTATQLMLLTIACSISNREPSSLLSDSENGAIEVDPQLMLLLVSLELMHEGAERHVSRRLRFRTHIRHQRQTFGRQQSHFRIDTSQCTRDSWALFKDHVIDVALGQRFGCGETCRTSTDDDDGIAGYMVSHTATCCRLRCCAPNSWTIRSNRTFASFDDSALRR